jgi:dTDP-4-dehydrorhamnose reductase
MKRKRKLIVTGAQGFVAGSVLSQAGEGWEAHAVSRKPVATKGNWSWHICEPRDGEALAKIFRDVKPHAVIHTAAIADIDFCQANPDQARAANVEFTRDIANLCGEMGARLVFCSTDTIFDGEHAPYSEEDCAGPVNFYAETKVEAERLVASLGVGAVTARLALVVGLPLLGAGNSFLVKVLANLKAGKQVGVPKAEVRTPVDVLTAGKALLELAAGSHKGIFHIAGLTRLNRLELGEQIAVRFGFARELVLAQAASGVPGRAKRPRDVSLCNARACAELRTPMLTFDEGLSLIMNSRPNKAAALSPL